ncbi:Na+:solute symporter [Rhabdobacter roseus]|uniref:SSS family transporter n=1 Tax=Rhabdobacter roseus TaxID=1655419 RepID=A0A840TWE0_9BACT|nr:sodium/solute symporter [Rhabdobacter roseus]MBB5287245.1 SSS family transporter [Rhabdobacter roseus]
MTSLVTLDYVSIVLYLVLMAGIGLFFKWYVKDINAYTKGSGALPWVAAGISNFMALFSTFIFVAYAGISYEYGLVSVTVLTSTVPACVIAAAVFAKKWRRSNVSTPVEYLETRFNSSLRQTVGWVGILMRILDNTVRLYAIGIFLTAVTPLSLPMSMILSSIIVIAFTLYGGLWAVSIMGTVQFIILLFTSIILFWLSLDQVGGFSAIAEKIPDHLRWFNGPKGQFFWLGVYYLMVIIKYNENWTFIQRFYSVRDEKEAQKVGYLSAALFLVTPIIFLVPPIVSRILMPELPDKEMAYVAISSLLLPPGLMGVMIASMFAATMSSLNSEYNVIASVLSKDVYQRLINKKATDKQLFLVAKIASVLVGLLVMLGALFIQDFGGAFEANKLFTGILAIPIGIPLVLGIVNRKATPRGAMLTVVVGSITGVVLNALPQYFSWEMATTLEVIVCLVIFYASGLQRPGHAAYLERVREFFKKLDTPIVDKPSVDRNFEKALKYLYAISLLFSSVLFIGMGLPYRNQLSGGLSIASGMVCLFIGLVVWWAMKNTVMPPPDTMLPKEGESRPVKVPDETNIKM